MLELQDVSRETQEKIDRYKALLIEWNAKINLVSPSTLGDIDNRHVVDGVALSQYVVFKEINGDNSFFDAGSGNGIPGIIMAMHDEINVTLVESDIRKCSFLQHVKSELGLNVDIICDRVENIVFDKRQIIVSRGFASIKKTADLVSRETYAPRMLLLKGKKFSEELIELSHSFGYIYLKTPYQGDRLIIDIQADKRKAA